MESEKVKEIKELLRCMNGEKACTNCYINEVAEEQETFCINVVADILTLINELESENECYKQSCGAIGQNSLTIINQLKDRIAELEKDNELLRNAKVVYESVDYCYEDLKKAEKRIAELEKENAKLLDSVETVQSNRCVYKCVLTKEHLKQFAERLKEKLKEKVNADNVDNFVECAKLSDETLKEFIK